MRKSFIFLCLIIFSLLAISVSGSVYSCWHLNENVGTNISDSSGYGRNGIAINNPLWVIGKLNYSLQFNGVNQYIDFGDIVNFERNQSASYEFWFNTSESGLEMVMSRYNSTSLKGLMIYLSAGQLLFDIRGSSSGYLAVKTNATFFDNKWHHGIITYDGSSSPAGVRIYVDGTPQNTTIAKDTLASSTLCSMPFYVGRRSSGNYWSGKLDEVVVYNDTILNSTEVISRYNGGLGLECMSIPEIPPQNETISQNITGTIQDLNSTQGLAFFFIMIFFWLTMLTLSLVFRTFVLASIMWLVGIIMGFWLIQISPMVAIGFLLFDTALFLGIGHTRK